MDIKQEIVCLKHELPRELFTKKDVPIKWVKRLLDILNDLNNSNKEACDWVQELENEVRRLRRLVEPDSPATVKEELRPCLHCSMHQPQLRYTDIDNNTGNVYYWCSGCGMQTADYPTEKEARKVWQRRANG